MCWDDRDQTWVHIHGSSELCPITTTSTMVCLKTEMKNNSELCTQL